VCRIRRGACAQPCVLTRLLFSALLTYVESPHHNVASKNKTNHSELLRTFHEALVESWRNRGRKHILLRSPVAPS
jgi:hypothetical protein